MIMVGELEAIVFERTARAIQRLREATIIIRALAPLLRKPGTDHVAVTQLLMEIDYRLDIVFELGQRDVSASDPESESLQRVAQLDGGLPIRSGELHARIAYLRYLF